MKWYQSPVPALCCRVHMLVGPASLTTWTGQQGIKVLRWLFQCCNDGMNGEQGQNTIHTAASVKVKPCLYFFTIVFGMGSSTAWEI